MFQYETPTQKVFNKLQEEKKQQQEIVFEEQNELLELEMSFRSLTTNRKPLSSNCHTSGLTKAMCSFAPCVSATICKDIKRHPEEEKHYKTVQSDLKTAEAKLKKLEEDITTKRKSLASSLNTHAARVQADLINSNQTKYLKQTTTGDKVPNWLIMNTDIRNWKGFVKAKFRQKAKTAAA